MKFRESLPKLVDRHGKLLSGLPRSLSISSKPLAGATLTLEAAFRLKEFSTGVLRTVGRFPVQG